MLFGFVTSAAALWPAGIYRFDAISGTVLDKETRKPIEGVVVVGHWGLRQNHGFEGSSYTGPLLVKEAITDKDGKFLLTPTITTDIHKSGHFVAELYPEIAFFKGGYDFTVYKHSGKYPRNGVREPFDSLKADEYLMPKWLSDSRAQIEKLKHTFLALTLTNTSGVCSDFETVTPRLLTALRSERDRLVKFDEELAGYFSFGSSLKSMESCISNLRNEKKP